MATRDYQRLLNHRNVAKQNKALQMTKHQFQKVVTLDRVIESRPPLRADLSGPTSTHYKISSKGNSPSYSFGR